MIVRYTSQILPIIFIVCIMSSCFQTKKIVNKNSNTSADLGTLTLDQIKKDQTLNETSEILATLTSDEFGGRNPGTEGYEKCTKYVEAFMKKNKIQPFFDTGFRDSLVLKGEDTYNIVGLIGDRNAEEYVVIGAHLDHLGKSSSDLDSVYNGANDNASGVTAVMQIAKELAKYELNKSVIVALFTAEEKGLIGSRHLVERLKNDGVKISYVLNFEMIGKTLTTGKNQVYITGYNKSDLASKMNEAMGDTFVTFLQAEIRYQLFSRSDNFPFYAEWQIPSHTISTFDFKNYDHYHKESDEMKELDVENMHDVINSSTYIVAKFLKEGTSFEMKKK